MVVEMLVKPTNVGSFSNKTIPMKKAGTSEWSYRFSRKFQVIIGAKIVLGTLFEVGDKLLFLFDETNRKLRLMKGN